MNRKDTVFTIDLKNDLSNRFEYVDLKSSTSYGFDASDEITISGECVYFVSDSVAINDWNQRDEKSYEKRFQDGNRLRLPVDGSDVISANEFLASGKLSAASSDSGIVNAGYHDDESDESSHSGSRSLSGSDSSRKWSNGIKDWHRLEIFNSYEDAICRLNQLQSPADARAKPRFRLEKSSNSARSLATVHYFLSLLDIKPSDLNRLNAIHVSGTKGKGSTCAFVESILRNYGYKTGKLP